MHIQIVNGLVLDGPGEQIDELLEPITVKNVCCVGAGYVGGPTAAVLAFQNPDVKVTVVDRDASRIRRWNSRHLPIYEPGLDPIVRIARDGTRACTVSPSIGQRGSGDGNEESSGIEIGARKGNLFFSTDVAASIAAADLVMIAVNTPTKERGAGAGSATDMTAFEAVTGVVARHARAGAIIVEKSTVPCRTAELVADSLAMYRPGVHFEVLSNPEFLAAGTAVNDLLYPDRVLIGAAPTISGYRAADALSRIYASWVSPVRILTTNVWSSELTKLVANSMLAQRISSINSISAVCEKVGADVDEVSGAVGVDPRIGDKFLVAGIGFGGSCFKKDVLNLVYLAETMGLPEVAEYWRQVVKMNEYARDRFTSRIVKCLNNTLVGKKITILGYAFKNNTSDTREAPALQMIKTLLEERPREITVFDPCCNPLVIEDEIDKFLGIGAAEHVFVYNNAEDACRGSTAVVIATEFDEFRNKSLPKSAAATQLYELSQSASRDLYCGPGSSKDPRPFSGSKHSENDLLALHKYLLQCHGEVSQDPLARYNLEPGCDLDCPDCVNERTAYDEKANHFVMDRKGEYRPKQRINWKDIAANMCQPKWVFDGRGVIDSREMEKLGVKVESVGRQHKF